MLPDLDAMSQAHTPQPGPQAGGTTAVLTNCASHPKKRTSQQLALAYAHPSRWVPTQTCKQADRAAIKSSCQTKSSCET
jgi:hypothetical protein